MASMLHAKFQSSGFLPVGTLVYAGPVGNEETLDHCIVDACQTIQN
jgi:hypothetical protein